MCKEMELPTLGASRISGQQEFNEATLRRIDFSKVRLESSVCNESTSRACGHDGGLEMTDAATPEGAAAS